MSSLDDVEGLNDSLVEALEVVLEKDEKDKLIEYYREHGEEGVKEVDVVELLGLEEWRRVKLSRLLVTDPRLMRAKNRVMEKYPDRFEEVKDDVEEEVL